MGGVESRVESARIGLTAAGDGGAIGVLGAPMTRCRRLRSGASRGCVDLALGADPGRRHGVAGASREGLARVGDDGGIGDLRLRARRPRGITARAVASLEKAVIRSAPLVCLSKIQRARKRGIKNLARFAGAARTRRAVIGNGGDKDEAVNVEGPAAAVGMGVGGARPVEKGPCLETEVAIPRAMGRREVVIQTLKVYWR